MLCELSWCHLCAVQTECLCVDQVFATPVFGITAKDLIESNKAMLTGINVDNGNVRLDVWWIDKKPYVFDECSQTVQDGVAKYRKMFGSSAQSDVDLRQVSEAL